MPCPANELGAIVPFVTSRKFRAKHFEARCALDGAGVLVARSGTALLRRVFDMPCPAGELGRSCESSRRENSKQNILQRTRCVDGAGVLVARSGTALLRRVFDMPCPADELGGIGPFVASRKFRAKHLKRTRCVDGVGVLVARSGTACRAPTVGKGKGEKNDAEASPVSQHPAPSCWGTGIVFMTAWPAGPVLLNYKFKMSASLRRA